MGIENAGIVEEDIEASEGGDRFIDGAAAFSCFANVSAQEDGLTAGVQDLLDHGMAAFLVSTGDGNLGAFPGEKDSGSFADAGGASGDESDFVLQTHVLQTHVRVTQAQRSLLPGV
jgi:hypothetical protein